MRKILRIITFVLAAVCWLGFAVVCAFALAGEAKWPSYEPMGALALIPLGLLGGVFGDVFHELGKRYPPLDELAPLPDWPPPALPPSK